MANCDTHWASPHVSVVGNESGHEIVVFADHSSVTDDHANHFVASAARSVPLRIAFLVGHEQKWAYSLKESH
jgi:hypothetical protein